MEEQMKKLNLCVEVLGNIQVPVELTEQISVRILAVQHTIREVVRGMEQAEEQEEERK